jgi:hypothetical protein
MIDSTCGCAPSESRWHFSPQAVIPQGLGAAALAGHKAAGEAVDAIGIRDYPKEFCRDTRHWARLVAAMPKGRGESSTEPVDKPVDENPAGSPSHVSERTFLFLLKL